MSLTKRNRNLKRRDIRRVLIPTVGALLGGSTLVAAHSFTLVRDSLRETKCDQIKLGQNTSIYAANGRKLATLAAENNRLAIPLEAMPKHLLDAIVAIEDKKFFSHNGIDYDRIAGAAVRDVQGGAGRQGGSTLTMQLVKNLCHPTAPRTIELKLVEARYAKILEEEQSKEVILKRYLNSVFFGNNSVGVQAASLIYFSKDASKLTIGQAALLAGLPQAPSRYNPFTQQERAIARRNLVLDEMVKDGYLDRAKAAQVKQSGLALKRGTAFTQKEDGFVVDYIESVLTSGVKGADVKERASKVKEGGFRVYTSVRPELQKAGRDTLKRIMARSSDPPSAAIAMLDVRTGDVLTMVSTGEYGKGRLKKFNLASDAKRPGGSTFKTFVLTEAIRRGINPDTTRYFSKVPLIYKGGECDPPVGSVPPIYTFGRRSGGMKTIAQATVASDNSIYSQMTCDLSPQAVFDTARDMGLGLEGEDLNTRNYLSFGLGSITNGTNVLDMARAYAPLANGGKRLQLRPIRRLVRANGTATQFKAKSTRIFSDGVAAEVTDILRANVLSGTGKRAQLGNIEVAGKTGTESDSTDAWFVGYTPRYVTAVWVGYPENRNRSVTFPGYGSVEGGELPAEIWGAFMAIVTKGEPAQSFPEAKNPVIWKPFSSYWTRQASALAAAASKKKAEAAAKDKAARDKANEDKDEDKDKGGGAPTPGTPPTPPPANPTPPPAPAPPVTPPPTP